MQRLDMRLVWGVLLVIAGALLLLQNYDLINMSWSLLWGVLFGLGGLFFLVLFAVDRTRWGVLIPGIILLSLASPMLLDAIAPSLADVWAGPAVLGGIGLSFWAVYLARRSNWWAIIPGGTLFTLAAVAGFDSFFAAADKRVETGGVFFLGLGLTFLLVAVLPNERGPMRWAYIPAGVLGVMGLLITAAAEDLLKIIGPVAFILAGAWLLYRYFVPRKTMA